MATIEALDLLIVNNNFAYKTFVFLFESDLKNGANPLCLFSLPNTRPCGECEGGEEIRFCSPLFPLKDDRGGGGGKLLIC